MQCNWCFQSLDGRNDATYLNSYTYHEACKQEYLKATSTEQEHGKGTFPITVEYPCGCSIKLIGGERFKNRGGFELDYFHYPFECGIPEEAIVLCKEHQKILVK